MEMNAEGGDGGTQNNYVHVVAVISIRNNVLVG